MKGLEGNTPFRDMLTRDEREFAEHLAEIERADEDRCKNCGGEDCMCCEYYHDRQRWVSSEELFGLQKENE